MAGSTKLKAMVDLTDHPLNVGLFCQPREWNVTSEFGRIMAKANAIAGSRDRKYYSDFEDPPSDADVAKAIKGIQGEVSDQLAFTMANTELLVSIKQAVWWIAVASFIVAGVAVRFAFANDFWL
jgi:hypothetical protein